MVKRNSKKIPIIPAKGLEILLFLYSSASQFGICSRTNEEILGLVPMNPRYLRRVLDILERHKRFTRFTTIHNGRQERLFFLNVE